MGDTPTSPGIRLRRIALATLSWLSPIRCPRLWLTLIGAILRPYGAGTPKSEHLRRIPSNAVLKTRWNHKNLAGSTIEDGFVKS